MQDNYQNNNQGGVVPPPYQVGNSGSSEQTQQSANYQQMQQNQQDVNYQQAQQNQQVPPPYNSGVNFSQQQNQQVPPQYSNNTQSQEQYTQGQQTQNQNWQDGLGDAQNMVKDFINSDANYQEEVVYKPEKLEGAFGSLITALFGVKGSPYFKWLCAYAVSCVVLAGVSLFSSGVFGIFSLFTAFSYIMYGINCAMWVRVPSQISKDSADGTLSKYYCSLIKHWYVNGKVLKILFILGIVGIFAGVIIGGATSGVSTIISMVKYNSFSARYIKAIVFSLLKIILGLVSGFTGFKLVTSLNK